MYIFFHVDILLFSVFWHMLSKGLSFYTHTHPTPKSCASIWLQSLRCAQWGTVHRHSNSVSREVHPGERARAGTFEIVSVAPWDSTLRTHLEMQCEMNWRECFRKEPVKEDELEGMV